VTIKHFDHVAPGDLITAPFFNSLIDGLVELQAQIDALGAVGERIVITELDPPGDITENGSLTIKGQNFAVPAVSNTIMFDTSPVGVFLSGTSSQLVINVPAGMPGVPGTKTLTISAPGKLPASRTVQVVRGSVALTGRIVIADTSGSLGVIHADSSYTFQFELDGVNLNITERFRVLAGFQNSVGVAASAWLANTRYVGTSGAAHEVTVNANTKVTFGVVVTIPARAERVDMTMAVTSVHNHPASSSSLGPIPIVVEEEQEVSSGAVVITIGQQTSASANPIEIGNVGGLQITFGQNPLVKMNATYTVAGTYVYGPVEVEADGGGNAGGWSTGAVTSPTPTHPANSSEILSFRLQAPATAPADGLQRYLRITATRQEAGSPGQLKSYYRFPIVGV
jgi:hypothetical protein